MDSHNLPDRHTEPGSDPKSTENRGLESNLAKAEQSEAMQTPPLRHPQLQQKINSTKI